MKVLKKRFQNFVIQDMYYLLASEFLLSESEGLNLFPSRLNEILLEGIDGICEKLDQDSDTIKGLMESNNKKLGHYCEDLWRTYFLHHPKIELLEYAWQINRNGITIGEIDFILKIGEQIIGMETSFKCYIHFQDGIEGWMGPKKKDRLVDKLTKVKNRQLPLFLSDEITDRFGKIEAFLYLKGHLFAHKGDRNPQLKDSEFDFISLEELASMQNQDFRFYLLPKNRWVSGLYFAEKKFEVFWDELVEKLEKGWAQNRTYILGIRSKNTFENYFILKENLGINS